MIHNDQELEATQERIAYFQRLLAQLRITAKPEEFPAVASGYRAEIVRMQDEVSPISCGMRVNRRQWSLAEWDQCGCLATRRGRSTGFRTHYTESHPLKMPNPHEDRAFIGIKCVWSTSAAWHSKASVWGQSHRGSRTIRKPIMEKRRSCA
jgi:hypothetical protein